MREATVTLLTWSSIGPFSMMMRSLNKREYMSKARSPREEDSMTRGMEVNCLSKAVCSVCCSTRCRKLVRGLASFWSMVRHFLLKGGCAKLNAIDAIHESNSGDRDPGGLTKEGLSQLPNRPVPAGQKQDRKLEKLT